jgi:hypothetical protein
LHHRNGTTTPAVSDAVVQRSGAALAALESVASQEQVVAEILHDLGNFFHKLYYWADYLRSGDAARDGDPTAGEMLEGTIKQLQDYLKSAFDYLAPVALSPTRITAVDVVNSLVGKVSARLCGAPVRADRSDGLEHLDVLVDPSRMSQALEVVVRQVASQVGETSTVAIGARTANGQGPAGIEVRIDVERCVNASPWFRTAEAGVEWALAEKLFDLHGGRLSQDAGEANTLGVVMFLPVCA